MMAFKAIVFLLYFPFYWKNNENVSISQSFFSIMTKIGQFMI